MPLRCPPAAGMRTISHQADPSRRSTTPQALPEDVPRPPACRPFATLPDPSRRSASSQALPEDVSRPPAYRPSATLRILPCGPPQQTVPPWDVPRPPACRPYRPPLRFLRCGLPLANPAGAHDMLENASSPEGVLLPPAGRPSATRPDSAQGSAAPHPFSPADGSGVFAKSPSPEDALGRCAHPSANPAE